MTQLELFQAFVSPAIFISATGLLILSINTRLMGIVTRLRAFHREKHHAALAGKKHEVLILEAQIESIQHRAGKIKNAFFYTLMGCIGAMITCLMLGLTLYLPQSLVIAVLIFVLSVLSMLVGMVFYISEVAISLSSEREEGQLYQLVDAIAETPEEAR